jgi:hypothetical protein
MKSIMVLFYIAMIGLIIVLPQLAMLLPTLARG